MRTRNASTTFHLVSKLKKIIFQEPDSPKQTLRSAPKFRRVVALLVFAALLGVSFLGLSKHLFGRSSSVIASTESISTFASNCTTPKTAWDLGGTACATATGAPDDRRIAWVAPDGTIAQVSNFFSGSGSDSYQIPTGSDPFAQVGTWAVTTIDVNGVVSSEAEFVVRDPNSASADLSVSAYGPFQISAGNNISYRVEVTNKGPDAAQSVVLTSSVPGDTTFVSESQDSGSPFTCTTSGTISCSLATLPANATAVFTLTFNVNAGVANGSVISNTASITSATNELHAPDNSASASSTVVGSTSSCTISCPSVAPVNTDQCSVLVNFAAPNTSGNCGINPEEAGSGVVCSPPSGSTFPVGNTVVTCLAPTGDSCSFAVTVNYTGSSGGLTIACPGNITVDSDLSAGTALVNYSAPTTNGNCVTVVCSPPSGSTFSTGTTTVTCTATDPSNTTATCNFTVTVSGGGGGCTLTCSGDITQSASSGQCNAVVTYAAPTTSGSCGTVTCSPASGSTFPVGTTVVTCSSTDGANCDFTVNVIPASPPTITTCATNKTISANASCEAAIPNLVGEVVATGCSVIISQSPAAGSIVGVGAVTVILTAENAAGEVTCTATVTVVENTPPVITTCPTATTASANAACQAAVPNVIGGVTATDNCTPAELLTVTQSPAAGTLVGTGTTTITVTVRDTSGNTTTCTTTFTVNDLTPPTISCPANISTTAAIGQTTAVVTFSTATAADNCSVASVVCSPASGSTFSLGITTVTCTATDASSNQTICTFKVALSGTLLTDADSFLRDGADNTNEGANERLRIQSSGHNRVLAKFNLSGIPTVGLQSATLTLNIAENSDNWGTTGRLVDAHRLLADWTEGNGHNMGGGPDFRGTGEGVTWKCAKDTNIGNQNDDCTTPWNGGTFAAATAAANLHINDQTGPVSWNVTADLQAGASYGWLIKKQTEGQNGQVRYYSREGAALAGNTSLAPRLVLVYQP